MIPIGNLKTVNKYGKNVVITSKDTAPVRQITKVLGELGMDYVTEFCFDATGYRRQPFDVCVLKDGVPRLLIEHDGSAHFDEEYYKKAGVREERRCAHVVKAQIAEAKKARTALHFGVPLLRVNVKHMTHIRDLLIAYITIFIDGAESSNNEVIMTEMLDRYGWDFPFVPCSSPSKEESKAYELHALRNAEWLQ